MGAFDRRDDDHLACAKLVTATSEPRVIPSPVLPEVDYFLGGRAGAFTRVIEQVQHGAFRVEDLIVADYERVSELLRTYADLEVGFVDCAVLAVTERLGEHKLATLDRRHFGVMRPQHVEALELLPG